MADIRMAGSALLNTVTEVATTATSLVTSVGTGAKMLNAFADHAHWKQSMDIKAAKVGYEDQLANAKALEIAKSRATIRDYVAANPASAAEIQSIVNELKQALA